MIDIAELARAAAEILAPAMPVLLESSLSVGTKVKEALEGRVSDGVMKLWDRIAASFQDDEKRLEVARDVAADPSDDLALGALRYELAKLFKSDAAIAADVASIVARTEISAQNITQIAGDQATQIANVGSIHVRK